jgi:2-(3-amino-3-carboxypropyl)histidine synthase
VEAKSVNADLIVHFGHAKFIDSKFPILYIEIIDDFDIKELLEKSLENLKDYKKIGLSYSVQHKHEVKNVIEFYKNNGIEVILSEKKGFAAYPGHVIGCEFSGLKIIANDVEAFLVIGNNFHSMGAAIAVEKPVYLLDVYNNEITPMGNVRDKILKQRIMSIDKFKQAKKVAIISEVKPGQKFGSPKFLIDKIRAAGKDVITVTMSEFSPDKLMNFYDVEAFVELACPRIAIDDFAKYPRPILTMKECLVAVGEKSYDDFLSEGVI